MSDNFAALRAMPVLEDVSDEIVKWLAAAVEEAPFASGDQIITEGDVDRDCYFIVEGVTDVAMGGTVVGQSPAGECEGEMALFFNGPRGCTTTATAPLRTLRLRAEAYDQLVADDPAAAGALLDGVMAHMARRFAK